ISILFNNGAGGFGGSVSNHVVNGDPTKFATAVAVGNFDGLGGLDIAVAYQRDAVGNSLAILRGNGNGTFQTPLLVSAFDPPTALVAADFNHDGKTDLAMTDPTNSDAVVLRGSSCNPLTSGTSITVNGTPLSLAAGDFNADGIPDLIVGNQTLGA